MPRGKEDSEGKLVAIDAPYGSDRDAQIEILKEMFPSGMNFFTHNPWGSSLDELVRELPGWVRENPGRKPTYDLFPFFKLRVEYVENIIGSQRKEGVNVFASPYMTPEWAAGAGVRRGSVSPLLSIYSSLPPRAEAQRVHYPGRASRNFASPHEASRRRRAGERGRGAGSRVV